MELPFGEIELPDAPLPPRWYALEVNLRGTSFTVTPTSPLDTPDGKVSLHRFHVGSLPLLNAAITPGTTTSEVWILTSEATHVVAGHTLAELVSIRLDGVEVSCAVSATSSALPLVLFECPGTSPPPDDVEIVVQPGIESTSGVPLRDGAGRSPATVHWSVRERGGWPSMVLDDAFVASTNG